MSEIATASIKTFASAPQSDPEQPSEEPIFLISASQLQDLLGAIQDLKDEVSQLRATVTKQAEKIAEIEATQDTQGENQFIQLQLINQLKEDTKKESPAPTEPRGSLTAARIDLLTDFCKARGGGVTFKEAGRLLGMKPNQMTAFVAQLDKRKFEVFTRSGDRRQKVIRLKTRINDC